MDKVIHAEFFVVVKRQLADDRAERDLRRLHVHLIENFLYLHHHLAVTQNDDGVGALIGDDLGIANRYGLGRGIDRLSRKFLRNIELAASRSAALIAHCMDW